MPSFSRRLIQGLNGSQLLFPAGGLDEQHRGAPGLAGEAVHGLPVQAQDLGGLPPGSGLQQLVHGLRVALEGARRPGPPLAAAHVPQPVRLRRAVPRPGRAGCLREPAGGASPPPAGSSGAPVRQPRCSGRPPSRRTPPRLCHRCQRPAKTWTASGAPAAPSNGGVGYSNCPNAPPGRRSPATQPLLFLDALEVPDHLDPPADGSCIRREDSGDLPGHTAAVRRHGTRS